MMMYMIIALLVFGAGGISLFFWLLQRETFGPAARARRKTVADARRRVPISRPAE